MFDSALVDFRCPVCGIVTQNAEIQFKTYLGKYSPFCETVCVGETIARFPKIPAYEVSGCLVSLACGCILPSDTVSLRFIRGIFVGFLYPVPEGYPWLPLPTGKNTLRKKRMEENYLASPFNTVEFFKRYKMPLFSRIFSSSPYQNYIKERGKWVRVTKY